MDRIIAYSPPYGENYLKEFEVFSLMHDCGIDVVKLILSNSYSAFGIPYSPYPQIWRGPGDYDFSVVDRQISDIVKRNPDVRFIAMVDLNSPLWIKEKMGRDSFNELGECYLDPEWLAAVEDYQEKLVQHLENNHADRIIAYYIACGRTQEWFDHNWIKTSPNRVANYSKWCRKNNREELPLPDYDKWISCNEEAAPVNIRQWKEYGNTLTQECAVHFFKRIRSQVRSGVKLGGVFGNIHDFGSNGHLYAEKFCREAGCDFYIGPSCNSNIPMGGASGFQSSQAMLRRYGISYLHSCDRQLTTTATEIGPGIFLPSTSAINNRQKTPAEDVACLKREVAISLVHGFSLWFFNIWGFSYRGKEVREALKCFGSIWKKYSAISTGTDAETLLVYSPEAAFYHTPGWDSHIIASQVRRTTMPEANIPFDSAAVSDLYEMDLSRYKMVVFVQTNYLSEKDLAMIRSKICCGGRTVVWHNQPGVISENGVDINRVEQVCGVPYSHSGWGEKDFGTWFSGVFAERENMDTGILRRWGKRAGLHFFTEDPDLKVWSSKEFISAHTRDGGTKTIRLKQKASRITELFSGKVIAGNTACFTDEFAAPDTKLYYLEYQ